MPFNTSPQALRRSLEHARKTGLVEICLKAEKEHGLPRGLLLAIASRETGCVDKCGDKGHGRGVFQIDDRFHQSFLRKHGALGAGGMPPVKEAAPYAARILVGHFERGRRAGVKRADLLKFVCSAYNAGGGGALEGYQQGDSDKETAHGNYGRDVLERLEIVREWLASKNGGARRTLKQGDRGKAVLEVKRRLLNWIAVEPPFAMTDYFGAPLTTVVKDFQRSQGLRQTGVVDEKTRRALDKLKQRTPVPA